MIKLKRAFGGLQFFASQPNNVSSNTNHNINTTADNTSGSNDLSPAMRTYYFKKLLEIAWPDLVHGQFGEKQNIPAKNGKTINFRKLLRLPRIETSLSEGITPEGQLLNMSEITDTVKQWGGYVKFTDMLDLTNADDLKNGAAELLGHQAGETIDFVDREELQKTTNIFYAPKVSNGTETPVTSRAALDETALMTCKVVQKVRTFFARNNIKPVAGQDYVAIIHPDVSFDLRRDPEFVDWNKSQYADKMFNGEIGRIDKVRFVEAPLAKIYMGKDLSATSRTLAVNLQAGYSGAISSIKFDGATVASDALKGRMIQIGSAVGVVKTNTADTITLEAAVNFGSVADNAVIYPGEGGKQGGAIYSTIFIGKGGYGTTEIEGGGLEMIVKQLGSSGSADPLNQRATIGWKTTHTTHILDDLAVANVLSGSGYMDLDEVEAN